MEICRQNEALDLAVVFEPDRCYGALATSLDGVQDIDLIFTMDTARANLPPQLASLSAPVLATASTTGPTASIAMGNHACFRMPLPIPMPGLVTLIMKRGAGVAGVELFSK